MAPPRPALLVILLVSLLCPAPTAAAPPREAAVRAVRWPDSVVENLVRTYRAGRVDEAVKALVRRLDADDSESARDAVEGMVLWVRDAGQQTRAGTRSWRLELEALLLLSTDALIETWAGSPFAPERNGLWGPIDAVYKTLKQTEPASPFLRQWYLVWEAFRQANIMDGWRGWPGYFSDALEAFPRDAQILLAAGARKELEWWIQTNGRRTLSGIPSTRAADLHALLIASRNYLRRSLAADPTESEAALRLTRVLIELEDLDAARQVLPSRNWDSDERAFEYLARLFEGDLAERAGDVASALAAYDRASTLVPTPQSALLAKSYVLYAAGRRAEALQAGTLALSGPDQPPDPWWLYSLGQAWRLSPYLRSARAGLAR